MFEILIKDGFIVDGTGNPWLKADVGIKEGRIAKVGRLKGEANRVIDAKGLTVAPGFIDIHNHSDMLWMGGSILVNNRAENMVRQGITTVATGNCGDSAAPITKEYGDRMRERIAESAKADIGKEVEIDWLTLREWKKRCKETGVGINMAPFCGFGTIRTCVMGEEGEGGERFEPTHEELEKMKAMVRNAMEDGAFGMTTGLEYEPQRNAYTQEIVELCKVVAEFGGVYMSHIRSEDDHLIEAVREAIEICGGAGVPGCISHHKACSWQNWGKPDETIRLIRSARERGVNVICDAYPWKAVAISNVGRHLIKRDEPLKEDELVERLRDDEEWEKIKREVKERLERDIQQNEKRRRALAQRGVPCPIIWDPATYYSIVYSKTRPDLVWKNFVEAAKLMGVADPWDAMRELYMADGGQTRNSLGDMREEDIITIYRAPWTAVCTDSGAEDEPRALHPRAYGSFPRFIERYVRELKVLTIEEAVRRMTSLPAQFLGLRDRGLVREGFWGDIVAFDLETVSNKATYAEPCRYPDGIPHVLVNGELVVYEGKHTGVLSGKVLMRAQ